MIPKLDLRWKIKVVHEHDFLKLLENRISHNPDMELLSINLVKTENPPVEQTFFTPKELNEIQQEDVIEVFL